MTERIIKFWCDAYKYKCPKCGKELRSLWETQLEANIREHNRKH